MEFLSQGLGFREIEFTRTEVDENGNRITDKNDYQQMLLNGQPFYLKGTNRHDTDPVYGKYVPHNVYLEDIKLMKQFNGDLKGKTNICIICVINTDFT